MAMFRFLNVIKRLSNDIFTASPRNPPTTLADLPPELSDQILQEAGILYDGWLPIMGHPNDTHAPRLSRKYKKLCGFDIKRHYYSANTFASDMRLLSTTEMRLRIRKIIDWIVDCGVYVKDIREIVLVEQSAAQRARIERMLQEEQLSKRAHELAKGVIRFERR